jgi:hypothetical protein
VLAHHPHFGSGRRRPLDEVSVDILGYEYLLYFAPRREGFVEQDRSVDQERARSPPSASPAKLAGGKDTRVGGAGDDRLAA